MTTTLKAIIITASICIAIFVTILIVQRVSFNRTLQEKTELAYLKGKGEVLIEQSKYLIDGVNNSLNSLKVEIDDTKTIISAMKEVSKNVSETIHNFLNRLTELDNAYNTLHDAWANSKRH
ncbi:MAG: hypothetical protein AMQ22_01086 [Candidatus Methanofastidiosum methylothiophilum]|uniref:Uncharacterized protein n=1 Tax=Candidatus Methanofastidiosum methylothiophilum TaxID=1705564 RepID=A0A150J409_9EURY|nr:MAG: hypothetical protein AMQ22_01086 [Candidatus Methanofastidiosum methylthiophilus]